MSNQHFLEDVCVLKQNITGNDNDKRFDKRAGIIRPNRGMFSDISEQEEQEIQ